MKRTQRIFEGRGTAPAATVFRRASRRARDQCGSAGHGLVRRLLCLKERKTLMDTETDHCIQLASGVLILAEKELSAFIRAVDKLFGAEQARQSALDWIEELGRMDWPSGESIPNWRRATVGASGRLGALLSDSKHRDTLTLRPVCSRPHRHVSEEIGCMSAIPCATLWRPRSR